MEFAKIKAYYNRCKDDEPLDPDDDRNIDLDHSDTPDQRPRGEVWVTRLAKRIELANEPTCTLLTGLPGSGKSTELRRLKARLQRATAESAHLFPALIDAEDFVDLTADIDVPDLLMGILYQTECLVLKLEGRDPDKAMEEGIFTRFKNFLSTELDIKDLKAPSLSIHLKEDPSFRRQVRKSVNTQLAKFLEAARRHAGELDTRVKEQGYQGLIIIVDSLEKLRGGSTNWDQVHESAEVVFREGAPYLQLPPVHVIYTVPAAMVSRGVQNIEFMPMIKIRDRAGTPFQPGIDALEKLVLHRIPKEGLVALLGDPWQPRLHQLIEWSGGYPRELLRSMRELLMLDDLPASNSEFQHVHTRRRDEYRPLVTASAFAWLARVAIEKYLTLDDEDKRPIADRMLSNNIILRYLNRDEWYDLHPAVRAIPGVEAAVEQLEKDRASATDEPSDA